MTEGGLLLKNQTYRMTMLFDFYGELLTERQKEFFDLYYNEDLSLSEIAENAGISRQGVRDVIVRAEAAMQEVEDKTGIIKRFEAQRPHLNAITEAAAEIQTLNQLQYADPLHRRAGGGRGRHCRGRRGNLHHQLPLLRGPAPCGAGGADPPGGRRAEGMSLWHLKD